MSFNIVQDTREREPLEFTNFPTVVKKLDTGDYSIEGLETILCIERKGALSEFYANVTQERFWRELERMQTYQYKFIVLEFSMKQIEDFPYSLNLPKKIWSQMKVTPKYLFSCIARIQVDYGVHVIFTSSKDATIITIENIMKKVHAAYANKT